MTLSNLLFQGLLGMCVTVGFAMLFNVPRKLLVYCAIIGAVGHVARVSLRLLNASPELSAFFAAFSVGVIGYWVAHKLHQPRLVFTVTGIISMVPGIPAYETIIYFSRNDILSGLQSGIRAGLITGAIAVGLSTARLITEVDDPRG